MSDVTVRHDEAVVLGMVADHLDELRAGAVEDAEHLRDAAELAESFGLSGDMHTEAAIEEDRRAAELDVLIGVCRRIRERAGDRA